MKTIKIALTIAIACTVISPNLYAHFNIPSLNMCLAAAKNTFHAGITSSKTNKELETFTLQYADSSHKCFVAYGATPAR